MGECGLLQEDARAIALNQALIDELKKKECIRSESIEAAFRAVLRHQFLPGTLLEVVYSDQAISAKQDPNGQWLSSSSQPAMMAIMLEQLGLEPGHNVLEIGTGTGYNAALMAHIVGESGRVVTVKSLSIQLDSRIFGRYLSIGASDCFTCRPQVETARFVTSTCRRRSAPI